MYEKACIPAGIAAGFLQGYSIVGWPADSVSHTACFAKENLTNQGRRGHGTEAGTLIADGYAGMSMVAFSEGADEFWGSQGWTCYEHAAEPADNLRMFVSRPDRRQ